MVLSGLTRRQVQEWLLVPAGWSTGTLMAGCLLFSHLRTHAPAWAVNAALSAGSLFCAWRAAVGYDEIPDREPATRRAAGWLMILFGLAVLGLIGIAGVQDAAAVPWTETRALVVEAETRSGQPWLAFTHETGGRQYMSAPFPAQTGGMYHAGSRFGVRYNPQQPAQIHTSSRSPARRTEKLFILAAAVGVALLLEGLKQARTLQPAPALTNRRREAIRQS